ncbi:hypothetical protein LguiA_003373 [Lonicera macranthoides]
MRERLKVRSEYIEAREQRDYSGLHELGVYSAHLFLMENLRVGAEISMGLDNSNEELSTCDLRIKDVENYLAPPSEAIGQQHISVDLTAHFVTDKQHKNVSWAGADMIQDLSQGGV